MGRDEFARAFRQLLDHASDGASGRSQIQIAGQIARVEKTRMSRGPAREEAIKKATKSWQNRLTNWKLGNGLPENESELSKVLAVIDPDYSVYSTSQWRALLYRAKGMTGPFPPPDEPPEPQPQQPKSASPTTDPPDAGTTASPPFEAAVGSSPGHSLGLDLRWAQVQAMQVIAAEGASGTQNNTFLPPEPPPDWPILVGQIPPLASAFQARPRERERIRTARAASTSESKGGVVLTQVLSGEGGVGKSQLAAACAREALDQGTDLVVWVDAREPANLLTAYARAARKVQALTSTPGSVGTGTGTVEDDARVFLEWGAATSRSWMVVLDDITDPEHAADWWPASRAGTGWVLATTRRRDTVLASAGRHVLDIDVYEPGEAHTYLTQRLTETGHAHLSTGTSVTSPKPWATCRWLSPTPPPT